MDKKDLSVIGDSEYVQMLEKIKKSYKDRQLKAAFSVNSEMLRFYYSLGEEIISLKAESRWGSGFYKKLSSDLRKEIPNVKGFSVTNLKYMRKFYEMYSPLNRQQPVDDLQIIFSIPWGHHIFLMTKCKNRSEALFYINKTIENGWSRTVLEHQIDGDLYRRIGSAVTNFDNRLPTTQSELAKQTIKDPYCFDFLTIRDKHDERELEEALVNQITSFLLELGTGFSYIGRQVHIKVGESDFYMDLLFYHVKLHCYVVVELKTEKFKPEFAGQLNFYVTAVNNVMKSDEDNQTIGILICRDKDNVVAEYSLENISQPIGISKYEISKLLKKEYTSSLPTIEEIEKSIKEIDIEN